MRTEGLRLSDGHVGQRRREFDAVRSGPRSHVMGRPLRQEPGCRTGAETPMHGSYVGHTSMLRCVQCHMEGSFVGVPSISLSCRLTRRIPGINHPISQCAEPYYGGVCKSATSSSHAVPEEDTVSLMSLYKFTRPHTMLGTFVSVISVSLLALHPFVMNLQAVLSVVQALVSALLMNVCIVGINQIYDVEIDKINKPYLPLAAGEFSIKTAWWIVLGAGALSLCVGGASRSYPLLGTLIGSLILGIAYSTDVPLLRWKKYPAIAAVCILSVRAILVQFGFFYHMKLSMGIPVTGFEGPVIFATSFMFLFSIVIALFKDIPDSMGDEMSGVHTFTVRWGQKKVFWMCIGLLELNYFGAVLFSLLGKSGLVGMTSAVFHAIIAFTVWWRAQQTDLESSQSIYNCYMDVWKAFYIEYLLFPLLG